MFIATVSILSLPYGTDNEYSYILKEQDAAEYMGDALLPDVVGMFAALPFGTGNRETVGLIVAVRQGKEMMKALKTIHFLYQKEYSLGRDLLGLCRYIASNTFCTLGDAVRCAFPTALLGQLEDRYEKTENSPSGLNIKLQTLYDYVVSHPQLSLAELCAEFGDEVQDGLRYLAKEEFIRVQPTVKNVPTVKYKCIYSLNMPCYEAIRATRSKKARALTEYLSTVESEQETYIKKEYLLTGRELKALCDKGILKSEQIEEYRNPYVSYAKTVKEDNTVLNEEQQNAYDTISGLIDTEKPQAALLYGVTGSGKTRVIKALCDKVIAKGKSVIMLVPEISLTPQSTAIFCACYGDRVAVIHSSLSVGERIDAWKRVKRGLVDMVIGTRSAIFAPLSNLGMVVIDEEQEHTYKSEMSPKYHARDAARYRCADSNALMLLASATPSVESFYKASIGKYTLVRMMNRYGSAGEAKTVLADMRVDARNGITDPIGTELKKKILENKISGNQTILFLNRRGYNNFLSCRECGNVMLCPNCDISLTYHTSGFFPSEAVQGFENSYTVRANNGYLMCHTCGYKTKIPEKCEKCGSEHIAYMGYGTQKIENDLKQLDPSLRILRMDADTTGGKLAYERILSEFRQGNADILLGTQMVTKGHDFPNVTLVGVLLADFSLYVQDYRANERTFSLLTQVIGRAGRKDKEGVAVIQTFNPEHEILSLASKQDYDAFYKGEIAMRKALAYPPFCDMTVFTFYSENENVSLKLSSSFYNKLLELHEKEYPDVKLLFYGPFEAPVYRVKCTYRMQLICKCKMNKRTREMFFRMLSDFIKLCGKGSGVSIDINPM